MTLTGDSIDAARAYELGLVNQVVAPDEVLNAAVAFAERIAANGPLAVAATKELVRLAPTDFARAQERLRELQPLVFAQRGRQGRGDGVRREAGARLAGPLVPCAPPSAASTGRPRSCGSRRSRRRRSSRGTCGSAWRPRP